MKKIYVFIAAFFIGNTLYGQIKKGYSIDCVQISNIEYLIVLRNNTNESIFLPTNPIVQKCNDTLFVAGVFSYKHYTTKVYRYKIDGVSLDVNTPLNNYLKPDTVYKEGEGYLPNFAVPSSLFELKAQLSYRYRVFNSANQQPHTVAFSVFLKNKNTEKYEKIVLGGIISARVKKASGN